MNIVKMDFRDLLEDAVDILGHIPIFPFTYISLLNIVPKAISIGNAAFRKAGQVLYVNRENIEYIDYLAKEDTNKLYQMLPYYIAMDINRILAQHEKKLVFICDSYVNQDSRTFEWLRLLIHTLSQGLFIITSREKLPWPSNLPVGQYRLAELPYSAAKKLILDSGITDRAIVGRILKITECIPIYLALVLNSYQLQGTSDLGEIRLFSEKSDIVKYFFSHLTQAEQEVVITLSLVRMFTREIFEFLIKELNLQCTVYDYDNLCSYRINPYIEETDGIVKVHDVLAKNMLEITSRYSGDVFERDAQFLATRGILLYNEHQLLTLAQNAYSLVGTQEKTTIKTTEGLLDLLLYLYENGSWQGIQRLLSIEEGAKSSSNITIRCFLLGLIERRTKRLVDGYHHLCCAEEQSSVLGKHIKSLLVHKYYVLSLCGDYVTAYTEFKRLYEQLSML